MNTRSFWNGIRARRVVILGAGAMHRQADDTREERAQPYLSSAHLVARGSVNLGYVAARELQDCRFSVSRRVLGDQHADAGCRGLVQGLSKIRYFISHQFTTVGIRQVPVSDEHGDSAEVRFDAYAPVGLARPPDLDTGRSGVIGDDLAVREPKKTLHKGGASQRRDIDTVFGH